LGRNQYVERTGGAEVFSNRRLRIGLEQSAVALGEPLADCRLAAGIALHGPLGAKGLHGAYSVSIGCGETRRGAQAVVRRRRLEGELALIVAFGDPASLVAEQPFALRWRRGQG